MVFDTVGGNIGRSADNDWVLPDPQRFVSAHHARIHYRDGLYILEDTSTNGVFINDEDRPVAKRGAHVLQNGDIIRFGEYQVVAMVETGAPTVVATGAPVEMSGGFTLSATSNVPVQTTAQSVEVVAAMGRAAQTDLGASLNLDDLLLSGAEELSQPLAVNAYGLPVTPLPMPAPRAFAPPAAAAPVASPTDLSAQLADSETERRAIARRIERLARAAARAQDRRATPAPAVVTDASSGLAAFCKGAGIAADHFAPEIQVRLLHLAGQLLREAMVGLKDLERLRGETLRPLQVQPPVDEDDPRPSLARSAVEDLLVQVLSQHESRRLDAVQWLREVMERARAHDRASSAALRAAFEDFVARLDPAELQSRFGRHDRGQRNWELYCEFYRTLAAKGDGQLPRVFLDAFASAYEEHLRQPNK